MSPSASESPNAAAEPLQAASAPPPGVASVAAAAAPGGPSVAFHEAPHHYDPLDPEHGWARPRRLGESRLAKLVLVMGLLMAGYSAWTVYASDDLDVHRDTHTSLITKIWEQGRDLIRQWQEGTNIPR